MSIKSMHTCQALILFCLDFRFQEKLRNYAQSEGLLNSYDLITTAGGPLNLIKNEVVRKFILEQIDISVRLHQIKKIYLIAHEDCGAYGGSKAFPTREEEFNRYQKNIEQGEKILKKRYKNIEVKNKILEL